MNNKCAEESQKVEEILSKSCGEKINILKPCNEAEESCSCSSAGASGSAGVDLVILVDSSGSMAGAWRAIDEASGKLEDAIKEACGVKAEITKLFLDTRSNGSSQTSDHGHSESVEDFGFISHEEFIKNGSSYRSGAIDYTGSFETNNSSHSGGTHQEGEEGSRSIADVANHFPWKKGACRSILYISDEWLDSGTGGPAGSLASLPIAINAANSNAVTVFTHLIKDWGGKSEHYNQLANATGGSAHIGDAPSPELYIKLVAKAACECGGGCATVENPEIMPCVSVSWGDSKCDSLETDDFEILCVSVCNCYSNLSFDDFKISRIEVTDSSGNTVAALPDGTPSVQAVPVGPICFGKIDPCNDGEATCKHREFVINTRGAKAGEYQIKLHGICFDVNFGYHQESCFKFKLCNS